MSLFIKSLIIFLICESQLIFAIGDLSKIDSTKEITCRLLLIGDAGESDLDKEDPILSALKEKALEQDSSLIIFLGDNVYPDGLVDESDPDRNIAQGYLDQQINAIIDANARGLFIPGNHDWNLGSENGWDQIKRQADYVSQFNSKNIIFAPLNGCPGPDVLNFGPNITIVILDTQWWLRDEGERPEPTDSICKYCEEESIINALDSILNVSREKMVVVAAHHPLSTYGSHGGHFNMIDHIFPLTNLNEYLWIPLPIIGSLYPLARSLGISRQDLSNSEYQNMKNQLEDVISNYDGIVFASGHEHALQVLDGKAENIYLVSGAGVWGGVTKALGEGDDTIFKGRYEGFMILDYYSDQSVRLSVIHIIDENGNYNEEFLMWLN